MLKNTMKKTARIALMLSMFYTVMTPANVMANNDVDKAFCDAIRDEKTYDRKHYKSYKMLVQGDDGWIFRTFSDFRTDFSLTDTTIRNMKNLTKAFKSQGVEFVVLVPPTRGLLHSDKVRDVETLKYKFTDPERVQKNYVEFLKTLRKQKINIVGLPKQEIGQPFFYMRDHHWSPTGARITAEELATFIKGLGVYKTLDKTKYKTVSKGIIKFSGTGDKVFKSLCGTTLPTEDVEVFATEPLDSATGDDLFGDVIEPQTVLVGTSNSTATPSRSNFEGFLKDALSLDILNKSISGGSIDSALVSYLNTDHYKQRKAKLVIWEVPGYYNLNRWEGRVFRQVTPAIYGDCEGNSIMEAKGYKIKSGTSLLFKGLDKKKIEGSDYYVSMKFSKTIKDKFTINFSYVNKKKSKLGIYRSKRFPHDGQFFVALKDINYGPLAKIILDIPKKMDGLTLDARICKIP